MGGSDPLSSPPAAGPRIRITNEAADIVMPIIPASISGALDATIVCRLSGHVENRYGRGKIFDRIYSSSFTVIHLLPCSSNLRHIFPPSTLSLNSVARYVEDFLSSVCFQR